ncbi:MAG: hypothetical protein R2809_11075 [Flavobacteriales bacterium]
MAFENTEDLKRLILGKTLTSIRLFNVNDNYFAFNPDNLAVIDGAVELIFDDQKLIIGWNFDAEFFDVSTDTVESLLGEADYYQIDPSDLPIGLDLMGLNVISLEAQWSWYYNLDDELEPIGPKQFVPLEVIVTLDNNSKIQLATTTLKLKINQFKMLVLMVKG